MIGRAYNRWTTVAYAGRSPKGKAMILARCSCGTEKTVHASNVLRGLSKSCGCLNAEVSKTQKHGRTHGESRCRTWVIWQAMKQRIFCKKSIGYARYGGRGLDIDPRWVESYEAFVADMGHPPSGEHSIERIDNDRGYWPDNCCWATRKEQAKNRRSTHWLTAFGETLSIPEWAERTGIPYGSIKQRLRHGWTPEEAVGRPKQQHNRRERTRRHVAPKSS